jgi:hypothetical protein
LVTTWVDIQSPAPSFPTTTSVPAILPIAQVNFLELRIIPEDIPISGGWKLASPLAVDIRIEEDHFIARVPFLDEYGLGPTSEAALDDLLTSLADYLQSLERREARLSDPLKRDIEILRRLLKK